MIDNLNFMGGIPQTTEPNPLLPAPDLALEARQQEEGWFQQNLETVHGIALEPERFFEGKDLSFARTRGEAQTLAISDGYLALMNRGEAPGGGELGRKLYRDEIALQRFDGRGVGDDAAFVEEIRKEAQGIRDERHLLAGADDASAPVSLIGKLRDAALSGSDWRPVFVEWQKGAQGDARFKADRLSVYQDHAESSFGRMREEIEAARPYSEAILEALKRERDKRGAYGGEDSLAALEAVPREMRDITMALVLRGAGEEGDKQDAGGHATQTFGRGLARQMLIGPSSTLGARDLIQAEEFLATVKPGDSFGGRFDDLLSAAKGNNKGSAEGRLLGIVLEPMLKDQVATEESIQGARAELAKQQDRFEMSKRLEQIAQGSLDPLKPGNWFSKKIGYPFLSSVAPSIVSVVATRGLTGSGTGAAFTMWGSMADDNAQQYLAQNPELSFAKAYEMGQHAAIYQSGLEYAETALSLGSVKLLGNALKTARASAVTTFAKSAAIGTVAQNTLEAVQDIVPYIVQDLDREAPGVRWNEVLNGENGYWQQRGDTFWALLPAVVMGAGGSTLRAKASRPELERLADATLNASLLKASGLSDQVQGPILAESDAGKRLDLFVRGLSAADPEIAAEGQRELSEAQARSEAAAVEAEAAGILPRMVKSGDHWTLYDTESGDEIGRAATPADASRLAMAHAGMQEENEADRVAYLATLLEAGEATQKGDTATERTTVDLRPGETMSQAEMALRSEKDEARIMAQVQARQALEGEADFGGVVLGENLTEFRRGVRQMTNRLYEGGSVLTVFHEDAHKKLRLAMERGLLDRGKLVELGRALDTVLAGKTTKDGRPMRLLPENDAEITDTLLDEFAAELMESEVIRTRKTGGRYGLGAGVISRNLGALTRIAAGATKSFKAFVDTFRQYFGLAVSRAYEIRKGIKEGKIDEAKLDEFMARMSGLSEQDELDAEAARFAEEILGDEASADPGLELEDVPFALGQNPARNARALPVLELPGEVLTGDRATLRKIVRDFIAAELQGKTIVNRDTGAEIGFSSESKKESVSKLRREPGFRAAMQLPSIVEQAVHVGSVAPGKSRESDTRRFDYFAMPVSIDGKRAVAWFNTRVQARGDRSIFYEFGLSQKERAPATQRPEVQLPAPDASQPELRGTVGEFLKEIKDTLPVSGEASFSLGDSRLAAALRSDAAARIKDPMRRTQAFSRIARSLEDARLQAERLELLAGSKRLRKSLNREAAMREVLRRQELENEVWARHMAVLSDDDLTKLKTQPGHAFLSDPSTPLRGRLMSKTAAIKKHPDMFQLHRPGDYDGSEAVSRSVFGGDLMPDQAAQEMFEMGLLREPSPDAMWELLESESRNVTQMREFLDLAKEELRESRTQAKDETNAWLREQGAKQAEAYSPREEILRSMALLDGILKAVPPEIRGKVGGYTQLARITTNEARLRYLKEKLAKVDVELEKWLREQYGREFLALLERAKPEKDEAGQKPKGKIGADVHELFAALRDAMTLSAGEAEAEALKLESLAASGELTAEQESHVTLEANLIRLVGHWSQADAARREAALIEATRVFESGYLQHRREVSAKREKRQERRVRMKAATKAQGDREERRQRRKKDEGTKVGRFARMKASLLSFEQLLHEAFGIESEDARMLTDWERRASNAKTDAIQNKLDLIEDLFANLAGSKFKGEALRWKMAHEDAITVQGRTFSELEAITATLMWRQEDGRRHMEGPKDDNGRATGEWNYSESFMEELEAKLSTNAKAVRLHLGEQYAAEYERLNAIYRDLYGVSLPRHKHYSPLTVKPQNAPAGQLTDPVTGFAMTGNGFTPGSLRSRSQSAVAEPEFRDAVQTYLAHVRQMEHWMAYAPFATEAMAVLNTRDVGNSVEEAAGQQTLAVLRSWLDFFAQGGTKDAAAHLAINENWNRITSRFAAMVLIGKASVLAIQSTQLGAGFAAIPAGAYLTRFAKLMTGRLDWSGALSSDFIQRRKVQMPAVVQQALDGLKSSKPSRLKHLVRKLGETIPGADALFTAGTYAIVHDYQKSQAKRLGLAGPQAEEFARNEAERVTERVAQPVRPGARSYYEVSASDPARRILWSFASDARQKFALSVLGHSDRSIGEKARAYAVTWLVGGVVATMVRSAIRDLKDDEDDEVFDERNWDPGRLALSALTGPLGGVPLLGDIGESSIFAAFGEYMPSGTMLDTGKNFVQAAKKVPDWFTGERDVEGAIKDAEAMLTALGLASDEAAAVTSLSHIVRDLFSVGQNVVK